MQPRKPRKERTTGITLEREERPALAPPPPPGAGVLDWLERIGNRCPDPIVLFLLALGATFLVSSVLAGHDFGLTDPRNGQPLRINDLLTLQAIAAFFASMTQAFVSFAPLGMVLVMRCR